MLYGVDGVGHALGDLQGFNLEFEIFLQNFISIIIS